MRRTIITLLCCVCCTMTCMTAQAQVKAFEKYSDTKNVTYVYISQFMLKLAGLKATPSLPGVNTTNLMSKLDCIQIISSEEKNAALKLKADTQGIVQKEKYGLLLQVSEENEKVDIYYSIDKKHGVVIMLTQENNEVTVIIFSGKFTLEDVIKMVNK